jgi:hypothetical protein
MSPGDLEDTDNILGDALIGSDNTHLMRRSGPSFTYRGRRGSEAVALCTRSPTASPASLTRRFQDSHRSEEVSFFYHSV